MAYILVFLEGVITFISPCILPMIPIYLSYMAGEGEKDKAKTLANALGFVLGFSLIFIAMGAFAGTLGALLTQHARIVSILSGILMILLGLNFMDAIRIPFLNASKRISLPAFRKNPLTSILFGMVFAAGWTPCIGAFLGSALMLAASQGGLLEGLLLLATFSLGLGIPFLISALVLDSLKSGFNFLKRHHRAVSLGSGIFLLLIGILMISGLFGRFLALLTF